MRDGLFLQLDIHLGYLSKANHKFVRKAYDFAFDSHANQVRRSGELYMSHPVAATVILASLKVDASTLAATLLHDVIEDTKVSKYIIIKKFGIDVANIVDGVSKITKLDSESELVVKTASFNKLFNATLNDIRVILVKLADRLHNMRTIFSLSEAKQIKKAKETKEFYIPIAKRLGLNAFVVELEEQCFKCLQPWRYQVLKTALNKELYKEEFFTLKKHIVTMLEAAKVRGFKVEFREKNVSSVYKKMQTTHRGFTQITDRHGIRIIVKDQLSCYKILGLIHGAFTPIENKFKDYIALPKANGYQSLHTVVFDKKGSVLEFQIRTETMHVVAQIGFAAHWLYKTSKGVSENFISDLKELQVNSKNSIEFLDNIKLSFSNQEIHVFSPKGDRVKLPNAATPIDFAYAISEKLGNKAISCVINNYPSTLDKPLNNGQTVKIITRNRASPMQAWLKVVKTPLAKTKIKQYLAKNHNKEASNLGLLLLQHFAQKVAITTSEDFTKHIKAAMVKHECNTEFELYSKVGLGNITPDSIFSKIKTVDPKAPMPITGAHDINIRFAKCCRPVPLDVIFGHISAEGLTVHRSICPHFNPEKAVRLEWGDFDKQEFLVDISVKVYDKKGVLAYLANCISSLDSNIKQLASFSFGPHTKVILTISVKDLNHLNAIIDRTSNLNFLIEKMQRKNVT